jgi:phosphoribosylpyrophosphate synthetase
MVQAILSLKELGAKTVTLYVTHGIFSKPLEEFKPYIDYIMCFQTVMNYVTLADIVKYNKGE